MARRVVVTGVGALSPLGRSADEMWRGLIEGRSGIRPISLFDASGLPVRIAGEVPDFNPEQYLDPGEVRKTDRFIQLALAATKMAVDDAGLVIDEALAEDVAVYVGSGVGGLTTICESDRVLASAGYRRVNPHAIPGFLPNMAAGRISILLGALGPSLSHVSACATGAHAIGEGARLIERGDAAVVIAGASEAGICPLGVAGFARMQALSRRNDQPWAASRPFDRGRDGFVVSEGAGIVVLEEAGFAAARGARIYAEIAGYGANADAADVTAPHPEGRGAIRCMQRALKDARWDPDTVQYINAHGTSTPLNDPIETRAIHCVFGEHARRLPVSSTKSMMGHLLGAAGSVEAIICALVLRHGVLPPTINHDDPDPACDLDYVPNVAREARVGRVLCNAFGFGGTNACLAMAAI